MALQGLYARESKYGEDILSNTTDNDSSEVLLKKAKAAEDNIRKGKPVFEGIE